MTYRTRLAPVLQHGSGPRSQTFLVNASITHWTLSPPLHVPSGRQQGSSPARQSDGLEEFWQNLAAIFLARLHLGETAIRLLVR